MRKPGIEPGAQRWQRWILPLNHLRLLIFIGLMSFFRLELEYLCKSDRFKEGTCC